jgi:hypothetical protein
MQVRNAINDFYAKKLHCENAILGRRSTTIVQIKEKERIGHPFLAIDNGVAQVFSVTENMNKPLAESLFRCTHWSHHKVDIHDYVFFNDTLWPKLRKDAPLECWFKGILLYCTKKCFKQPCLSYKIAKMTQKQRCARQNGNWPKETYCICGQSTEPDFNDNLRKIKGPVSFASVRKHQESDFVVSVEVETMPEFRRKGMAKAVLAYATEKILNSGRIPLYGTSPENFGSLATARSIGYQKYGKILGFMA